MADFVKFQKFVSSLVAKKLDFSSDTFKVLLTNTAPTPDSDQYRSALTEISAGNGYTAGGTATTLTVTNTSGTLSVAGTDVVFTATGAVGPFRYAVIYDATPGSAATDPLVGYWDYGSSVTLANGETFTVDFGTQIFTLA